MSQPFDEQRLDRYVEAVRPEFESALQELVEIPTVSMDPARKADMQAGAEAAAARIRALGGEARILETALHPLVWGRVVQDASYPTLTLYNHLDVQPADREKEGWRHEPFRFVQDGERYLGRGSTDDKGPALTAYYAIRYAVENRIPLNFQFLWEMEEEIGSPSFAATLKEHRDAMRTDSVLVSDTIWISRTRPASPYGLRGVQAALLRLETGVKDVHSGLTGGAARNPLAELMAVVSRCHDAKSGRVKIPGFYEDVARASRAEVDSFERSGFRASVFKKAHELRSLRSTDRRDLVQRIWSKPTFEVHGVKGGYSGDGVKTVVPQKAEVKVSMRLVPEQRPAKVFRQLKQFVRELNPDVKVISDSVLEPYLGDFTGPYNDAARRAVKFGFGREPALIREGGSIGAVVSMEKILKAPITFLGLSLPEHGYHAPNEFYDWGQAYGGMKMFVRYFSEVAGIR
ncbi:MAG: M20/M25/M40 family metallo-hydrolase [Acidobacteriota bacterium]|jgi:acetylornithine deacetylase/succinyl-diaminopimelate desuccinylase-like protein